MRSFLDASSGKPEYNNLEFKLGSKQVPRNGGKRVRYVTIYHIEVLVNGGVSMMQPTMGPPMAQPVGPVVAVPIAQQTTSSAELGGADEVARALERIESLKKSGLITDSEYEAKRAEVLRRL